MMNSAATPDTSRASSHPSSPLRRVRRPAPVAAVACLPPVRASPVQPALRDPRTGALTLQHPHSCQSAHNPASGAAGERAVQPEEASLRSNPEASAASASGQTGLANGASSPSHCGDDGAVSETLHTQQTVPASCQQPAAAEAYRIGRLWVDERFVACRLLSLVALAKQLMSLPATGRQGDAQVAPVTHIWLCCRMATRAGLLILSSQHLMTPMICVVVLLQGEHVANACSALVAFYAVSLWETMSDHVASPLLDVFAERLQVRIAGISSAIIAAVAWPGKRLDSALLARASLLADRSCSSSRQMSHQKCKLNE